MRVAVVGCGSIGRRHLTNLLACGCDVFAVDVQPTPNALRLSLSRPVERSDVERGLQIVADTLREV